MSALGPTPPAPPRAPRPARRRARRAVPAAGDLAALVATTAAGAAFVDAATRFSAEFESGAMAHDRDGTFAVEHLEKLRADRFLVAPVPAELGGGGVTSVHDVLVASSRLARGDPATTIGVNMHLAGVITMARSWRTATARGEDRSAAAVARSLRHLVEHDVVLAAAISEPSPQDLTRPSTTATRVAAVRGVSGAAPSQLGGERRETGYEWRVSGRKAFATMAPHATLLNVAVTYVDERGGERYGFASVPVDAPGVVFHDDWDALGMRASASGSVSFSDVGVGADGVRDAFPAGTFSAALLDRFLVSGALHAAVSLGIAEQAHATSLASLRRRASSAAADPHAVTELAANVVDVQAMRASVARAGRLIDDHVAAHRDTDATMDEAQAVFADVQAAKAFVTTAAVRVVDRALALSGGAGYLAASPLAKAWRDVRAGAFMHPTGANRAASLLARTALGLAPAEPM